ncbi:hypothetical protein EVAR_85488_1 [Eumeta japonica]|uniref:Uncharacterized protein n=1 Tax=Eumeta variegata TaxID=151549 RepID=A0A4C1VBK6_EUMVA|nr:hypothetical protein EVAR_85488_1 [Eumeta japonica]
MRFPRPETQCKGRLHAKILKIIGRAVGGGARVGANIVIVVHVYYAALLNHGDRESCGAVLVICRLRSSGVARVGRRGRSAPGATHLEGVTSNPPWVTPSSATSLLRSLLKCVRKVSITEITLRSLVSPPLISLSISAGSHNAKPINRVVLCEQQFVIFCTSPSPLPPHRPAPRAVTSLPRCGLRKGAPSTWRFCRPSTHTEAPGSPYVMLSGSSTVQRTKLYRCKLAANDVMRGYYAPQPFLLLPRIPILRHCDAFVTNFRAAKLHALYWTSESTVYTVNPHHRNRLVTQLLLPIHDPYRYSVNGIGASPAV